MTERELEIELSTLRAELATVKADLEREQWDCDDWRDIAIGLYDLGGVPLIQDAERYAEVVARYEAKIKKGG